MNAYLCRGNFFIRSVVYVSEVITRKRGSKWEYRFELASVGGKRSHASKSGFKTKKEALEAGAKAFAEYNNTGIPFSPSEISVSDYLDFWIKTYCIVNLKETTVESYKKKIRLHIKPAVGKYRLKSISPIVIQDFINSMFDRGYSRNTVSSVMRILSGSFNYAVNTAQLIQYSPMSKVKMPSTRAVAKIPTRTAPNIYIEPQQVELIFKRFPEGTSTYIPMQFGYRCGMRLGEAFGVCWDDINWIDKTVTVNRQVQWDERNKCWYFSAPKYNSVRTIELDNDFYSVLTRERDRQRKAKEYYDDLYENTFVDEQNKINNTGSGIQIYPVAVRENGSYISPRTMQHTSSIIHHSLGISNFTFHSFRHTHATMLAEAGAPLKYAQERLGHKNVNVTMQIYQHTSDILRQKGSEIVNEMLNKKQEQNTNSTPA